MCYKVTNWIIGTDSDRKNDSSLFVYGFFNNAKIFISVLQSLDANLYIVRENIFKGKNDDYNRIIRIVLSSGHEQVKAF